MAKILRGNKRMPHKNYGSQENKAIQSLKMEDNGMFILLTQIFLLNMCIYSLQLEL